MQSTKSKAWMILFMLAVHEAELASAARASMQALNACAAAEESPSSKARKKAWSTVVESFSFEAEWARYGAGQPWTKSRLEVYIQKYPDKFHPDDPTKDQKFLKIRGLDKTIMLKPDAAIGIRKIKGMPVVQITGWQEWDKTKYPKRGWSPNFYERKEALFIRAETNKQIGVTTKRSHPLHLSHPADLPVYGDYQANKMYFMDTDNSWNEMFNGWNSTNTQFRTIERGHVAKLETSVDPEPFTVTVRSQGEKDEEEVVFDTPDEMLAKAIDGLLSRATSLEGQLSLYRCTYDAERDSCFPGPLCRKTAGRNVTLGPLAPFGGTEQMCENFGSGESHAKADKIISIAGIDRIKDAALETARALQAAEDVDQSEATRDSKILTKTLWAQANEVLGIIRTIVPRIEQSFDPQAGARFPLTTTRLQRKDMLFWQYRSADDRVLTTPDYEQAAEADIETVKEQGYNVAAKLHSELVRFLIRRPFLFTGMLHQVSGGTCAFAAEEQTKLEAFANYYLQTPGFSLKQVEANEQDFSDGCQQILMDLMDGEGQKTVEDKWSQEVDKGEQIDTPKGPTDEGARSILGVASDHDALLQQQEEVTESESVFAQDSSFNEEVSGDFGFTILCIFVCIVCMSAAGLLFGIAGSQLAGRHSKEGMKVYMCAAILGAIILIGAFALATGVGVIALIGALAIGAAITIARGGRSFIQLQSHEVQVQHRKTSMHEKIASSSKDLDEDHATGVPYVSSVSAWIPLMAN